MILFIGAVGQGPDQAPRTGNIRFQSNIGHCLDQFQIIHEIIVGINRDLLAIDLADRCPEGIFLFLCFQAKTILNRVNIPLIDFQGLKLTCLWILVFPHFVRAQIFRINPDNHIDIIHHILADGQGFIHIGIKHFRHDSFTVQPLGNLQIIKKLSPVIGFRDIVKNDPLDCMKNIIGKHTFAFVGFRPLQHQLNGPTEITLTETLLTKTFGDIVLLAERINHFRKGFQAFFSCNLSCRQLHGLNRGQFLGPGQPGQNYSH